MAMRRGVDAGESGTDAAFQRPGLYKPLQLSQVGVPTATRGSLSFLGLQFCV